MGQKQFKSVISGTRGSSKFDSSVYFSDSEVSETSPFHKFVAQRETLTKILGKESNSEEWRMKANLVTIGIVSSVESYFRSVIRRLLIIDEDSKIVSYRNKVSYGAVLFHVPHLLPEALLEDCTFLNKKNIRDNLKNHLGVSINFQKEPDLDGALEEYEKVCHLRHCIAHRSGHLGSKNAIELGLEKFSPYLEKPISPTLDSVNNVFNICQNAVMECNDHLFDCIIERSVSRGDWTGDLRRDKKEFKKVFNIFSPYPNDPNELKKVYKKFVSHFGIY